MPDTLPETFGRYRIVKKLGAGGMGAVYLAHDTQMDRPVALKIPHIDKREADTVIAQFYREARIVAKILHPNVCPVFDVGAIDGTHFLTMAYLDGSVLTDAIQPGQPWPVQRAVGLALQVAAGLHELHRHGIVHRDLKPGNILLKPNDEPVLLDFGLARSVVTESQALATKSAMQGTPAYMAPEQMAARPEQIKPWTDVYALGAILYELLTGERPFQPVSLAHLCAQVMHAERPRPSERVAGIPPALDQLCLDALAIDPTKRPLDMPQLSARLKQCQNEKPTGNNATQCPQCGKCVRILDKMARKKVLCPGCRAPLPFAPPVPSRGPLAPTATYHNQSSPEAGAQTLPTKPPVRTQQAPLARATTNLFDFAAAENAPTPLRSLRTRSSRRSLATVIVVVVMMVVSVLAGWLLLPPSATTQPSSQPLTQARTATATPSPGRSTGTKPTPPPPVERAKQFTNSIGMQLVLIPAGKFMMGATPEDRLNTERCIKDAGVQDEALKPLLNTEQPQHEVEITQPFYFGVYEVTQEEYETVVKFNSSWFRAGGLKESDVQGIDTRRFPVEFVTWEEAVKFCETLTSLPAEKARQRKYRLPTEAEWECACRGGAANYQIFHVGDKLTSSNEANFNTRYPYGSTGKQPSLGRPVAVDDPRYKPNGFGLYHMHGNVWEWCQDRCDDNYYQTCLDQKIRQDPTGPLDPQHTRRILRGGSWLDPGWYCRSAVRYRTRPNDHSFNIGFRVVCVSTPQ